MKECPKCKQQKPEISFGKRVSSALSTKKYSQSWCSECRKESVYKGRGKIPLHVVDWSRRQLPPRQFEVSLPLGTPLAVTSDPDKWAAVQIKMGPGQMNYVNPLEPQIPTDRNELKALYHRLTKDQQSRSANRMTERLLGRWKRGERW